MLRSIILLLLAFMPFLSVPTQGADPASLVGTGRALAFEHGARVWPGFAEAPFGILLVDGEQEMLFCHDGPAADFLPIELPGMNVCKVKARPTSFPPDMLASFPAVDGQPTVVMGTPQSTKLSRRDWLLVLQHEHFHQMQYAWKGYYAGVESLQLSGGDNTGMWMLNYPFPYDDPDVVSRMQVVAQKLKDILETDRAKDQTSLVRAYWEDREALRETLAPTDWRYLELQLWQEGVARWTELAIASVAPGYAASAEERRVAILSDLADFSLAKKRRTTFYSLGAAEAMLLDSAGSQWRRAYWTEPFSLAGSIKRLALGTDDYHAMKQDRIDLTLDQKPDSR